MNTQKNITALYPQNRPQPAQDAAEKRKIVIAVDGPAAAGKGTLARNMAERLGYAYLDTGALYRAVALATLETGGNPEKAADIRPALDIIRRNLTPELLQNPALRTAEVSAASSKVAAIPDVRQALLDFQRDFAKNPPGNVGGAVLDGRDIGTVICPDADVKFYITATPEIRAERRFRELGTAHQTYENILAELIERDTRDSTRATARAVAAEDAVTIDTSAMNATEVLEEAVAVIRSKFLEQIATA